MPAVDSPYIIAVIRHLERELLAEDDFTLIIEAKTNRDAIRALVETRYGQWMEGTITLESAFAALTERLVRLQRWLVDTVDNENIILFLQARYDALNIASALIERASGSKEPGELSRLGSINPKTLFSVIWHATDWENIPEHWEKFIRENLNQNGKTINQVPKSDWRGSLLSATQRHATNWMDILSETKLTKDITRLTRDRLYTDSLLRGLSPSEEEERVTLLQQSSLFPDAEDVVISNALNAAGYTKFSTNQITAVKTHTDGTAYERVWDEQLVELLKNYRSNVIGYDAIVAYWFTVELEVKTIRLILSAKLQGLNYDQIRPLLRPLLRSYA